MGFASSLAATGPRSASHSQRLRFQRALSAIVAAVEALPAELCVIDGEAIACDERGLSVFDMIRWRQHDNAVTLCAFDLLELDGEDLRREPIEVRKATLRGCCAELARASRSIAISKTTALLFTNRPARSAARASSRSALARPIGPAVSITGSRLRTRSRPLRSVRQRKTGTGDRPAAPAAFSVKEHTGKLFSPFCRRNGISPSGLVEVRRERKPPAPTTPMTSV